ncbi:hypothetical protein AB4K20DRAFT_1796623 [Rhizopus microsporus]|uniref:Uncharacterized protein n=1 Tax=Rhizopus microsporus TaxID=58291 RepID=A0A1X0RPV6_RHIZD|nr:hypothetical protein BCV71DRAFT_238737 [Rhizopus microsporus]
MITDGMVVLSMYKIDSIVDICYCICYCICELLEEENSAMALLVYDHDFKSLALLFCIIVLLMRLWPLRDDVMVCFIRLYFYFEHMFLELLKALAVLQYLSVKWI